MLKPLLLASVKNGGITSERSIKPFVIGRKNWLFHDNDIGARAGSILYSLIETCKYHKVDVFSWFKYALTHIQQAHSGANGCSTSLQHQHTPPG
ncbi:hypothetical protein LDG_7583 [Legionella drancourtii LLAP12]|uniref:Uncharacterized protein n=1 Tax=Legionella drancourtii LLAP12 TaxID=658187 RepID=G9EQN5_9GAMM|nr:transposase domain-containing protein [Legionella drancourtii]EHL30398.1 hypothetical protein LDG_7583 [Legionella drancourtii LLAP12]